MDTLPNFLRVHLDRVAKAERFLNYKFVHETGSRTGDGFMGEMVAVTLRGLRRRRPSPIDSTDAFFDDSLSLICKLLPRSIVRQQQCKMIFEREVHIYRDIIPQLQQFQADKGLTDANGFFAYPHCYVAVADEATNDYVIIMDDMRAHGYRLWDKFQPMPVDTARQLFEQLGRLQGLSLVLRDQRPELFASIRRLDDLMLPMQERMHPLCESSLRQAVRYVDKPEHKRVLQTLCDTWSDVLKQCGNGATTEPFSVLGHGDCWNNNMMFKGENKVCLIDWQIARYSSPALDLSYFLFSSTNKAWRDKYFESMLRVYHENLCDIGRACGNTAEPITMEQLRQQLREYGRYGVVMAPILLQLVLAQTSTIVDFDQMASDKSAPDYDASRDVEVTKFDAKSLAKYRQLLAEVCEDALRFGWV